MTTLEILEHDCMVFYTNRKASSGITRLRSLIAKTEGAYTSDGPLAGFLKRFIYEYGESKP